MSGLVFGGGDTCSPSIIPPLDSTPEPLVTNDGWFPDIDAAALRNENRITDKVTPVRLRAAILGAMVTVGVDLGLWALAQAASGSASLEAVPAPQLGGESRLVILYRRAVACFVKAELVGRNPDLDATGPGLARAEALEPTADELRRDGRHAVRDMLGRTRTDVELI